MWEKHCPCCQEVFTNQRSFDEHPCNRCPNQFVTNLAAQIVELEALDIQINSGLHESYGHELVEYHQKSKQIIREQQRLLVEAERLLRNADNIARVSGWPENRKEFAELLSELHAAGIGSEGAE